MGLRRRYHDDSDVIDPLGGSYYIERLTDEMEEKIEAVIAKIDALGGMYKAVESGAVQGMIGQSAIAFQEKVERGEQKIVGVNCYQAAADTKNARTERPDPAKMSRHLAGFMAFKAARSRSAVRGALSALARAANSREANVFAAVVDAAAAGVTHGEIVACLRSELGFGNPLIAA